MHRVRHPARFLAYKLLAQRIRLVCRGAASALLVAAALPLAAMTVVGTTAVEAASAKGSPGIVRAAARTDGGVKRRAARNYTIAVLGDSLGDGVYVGLRQLTRDMDRVTVKKYSRVNTGIARADRYNWNRAAERIARQNIQIAVMVFGANDLQSMRVKGRAHHYRQPGWVKLYTQRVDGIMRSFSKRGIPVYWVSLPITRKDRYQKDYAFLNTIFRSVVRKHGGTFIDTWSALADKGGHYSPYGVVGGRKQQIRATDGVHFTPLGYQLYAGYALKKIRSDFPLTTSAAD